MPYGIVRLKFLPMIFYFLVIFLDYFPIFKKVTLLSQSDLLFNLKMIFSFSYCFYKSKRRDGRVVEGAALEMLCRGDSTEGSNPSLSATINFLQSTSYTNPQTTNEEYCQITPLLSSGFFIPRILNMFDFTKDL